MKALKPLLALLILTVPLLAAAAGAPPPSIGVSPSRLEIAVGHDTTTGSATVLNMSDRPIHVTTSVVNFDLDDASNFRELPPEAGSLPTAMMINPVDFTIPPNGTQTVRFAIMPERLSGTGEHRAMLFFSELVDTTNAAVKLNFRLGMPIYASFGDVNNAARLHQVKFQAEQNQLQLDISALGNAQVLPSGYYLWWPIADFLSEEKALAKVAALARNPEGRLPKNTFGGRLATKPVFPGARRSVAATLAEPPDTGEFMLVYHVSAGDQQLERAMEYVPPQVFVVDSD